MTQTIDKPITTLKHDTASNAYEAIIAIESRAFTRKEAIAYSTHLMGMGLYEMEEADLKKYAKHLIADVQGISEGQFDNSKFQD